MSESRDEQIIAEFRDNGGQVGGHFSGAPLLLLHTTGAKSREPRISPVMYQSTGGTGGTGGTGDRWAVFASYAGKDINPGWYHNLKAHPQASIEVGTERVDVQAHELVGEERSVVWEEQKRRFPGFAEYESKTSRTIPVVLLTRR